MARKTKPKYKKDDLIKMIVDKVCEGIPQAQIKQDITGLDDGYSAVYFYELYRDAKPIFREALKGVAENRLESTIEEMEVQYQAALSQSDGRLANEIRKEINKISGLHQQKVDITTQGEKINNIEIIKIIEIKNNEDDI
jgi:hypothetical protein